MVDEQEHIYQRSTYTTEQHHGNNDDSTRIAIPFRLIPPHLALPDQSPAGRLIQLEMTLPRLRSSPSLTSLHDHFSLRSLPSSPPAHNPYQSHTRPNLTHHRTSLSPVSGSGDPSQPFTSLPEVTTYALALLGLHHSKHVGLGVGLILGGVGVGVVGGVGVRRRGKRGWGEEWKVS